jgi:hypothetical protein
VNENGDIMAKMKIHVWHGVAGEIIAVGHPTSDRLVTPLPLEGQLVLETEIDESLVKNLYKTHIVDVQKKVLIEVPQRS